MVPGRLWQISIDMQYWSYNLLDVNIESQIYGIPLLVMDHLIKLSLVPRLALVELRLTRQDRHPR